MEPIGRPDVPTLPAVTRTASRALFRRALIGSLLTVWWMRASLASMLASQFQSLLNSGPSSLNTPRATVRAMLLQGWPMAEQRLFIVQGIWEPDSDAPLGVIRLFMKSQPTVRVWVGRAAVPPVPVMGL